MKRIFHILSILVVCVVACNVARAQSTTPKTSSGDKALLFSINGFGTFGVGSSLIGSVPVGGDSDQVFPFVGFGMKLYISDRTALRGALGFGLSSKSTPNGADSIPKTTSSTTTIGIAPAIEFHMMNAGPVSGYLGAFVLFATSSSSTTPRGVDSLKSSGSGMTFGVGGILGAEFFPWSNISLAAEYQLGLSVTSTSSEFRNTTTDGPTITNVGIGSLAVILGVYW
jgi:opacity protein-like surface antigen